MLHRPHSSLTYSTPSVPTGVDSGIDHKTTGLVPSVLGRIFPSAKIVHFTAHEVIHRAGTPVEALFALRRGMVKSIYYFPNGRARIVRLHVRGDLMGLGGLLGQEHKHAAIATNDVVAYRIPLGDVQRLGDDLHLYRQLATIWYDELRAANDWLTQLSTGSSKARVARLITYLSRIEPEADVGHVRLLTCDDMAAILGITLESVSRTLAQFKRDGLLRPMVGRSPEWYQCALARLNILAQDLRARRTE